MLEHVKVKNLNSDHFSFVLTCNNKNARQNEEKKAKISKIRSNSAQSRRRGSAGDGAEFGLILLIFYT